MNEVYRQAFLKSISNSKYPIDKDTYLGNLDNLSIEEIKAQAEALDIELDLEEEENLEE